MTTSTFVDHQIPIIVCFFLQAWVYFYPTVDQQKSCDSCDVKGMNGDLVIVYDVKRDIALGHIKVQQELFSRPPKSTRTFEMFFFFK